MHGLFSKFWKDKGLHLLPLLMVPAQETHKQVVSFKVGSQQVGDPVVPIPVSFSSLLLRASD